MKIELEVLDGPQKGKRIPLKNGLQIGRLVGPLSFEDEQMADLHGVLSFDQKKLWNIECLAPLKLRLGFEEVGRAQLLLGLIFHLGQTGFKVVERPPLAYDSWDDGIKDWLQKNPGNLMANDMFFFLNPVRLTFIQGAQYEDFYTLSYGPREMGFNNLDLNIKDPSVPQRVAKFFQIGDQVYIENLCGDKARINGAVFDQHPIVSGDRLTITSNVIELSLLK
ncbi:MAG: hypothetical protein H7061_11300 [Bdellovibrionaceae bacterium]|nr:hypothetical protein [Bdellovibrio sp.]